MDAAPRLNGPSRLSQSNVLWYCRSNTKWLYSQYQHNYKIACEFKKLPMAAHLGNYSALTNTMKDVAAAGGAFILIGTFSFNQRRPAIVSEAVDEHGLTLRTSPERVGG